MSIGVPYRRAVCKARVGTCLHKFLDKYSKIYNVPTQNILLHFVPPKIFNHAPPMNVSHKSVAVSQTRSNGVATSAGTVKTTGFPALNSDAELPAKIE